jgi:hypothetical protein
MKFKMNRLSIALLAASMTAAYSANAYIIDPDGAGGDAAINVSTLDWNVGNLYVECAVGGCADNSPTNLVVGDTLQSYAHAELSVFNDQATTQSTTLGTNYEWTFVTGFQETVSLVAGAGVPGAAGFENILGGNNFFEIYYDDTPNGNQLIGADTMIDGTLILSGSVLPFDLISGTGGGSFTATSAGGDLDQNGADDYLGVTTVTGNGSASFNVDISFIDTDFFIGGDLSSLLLAFNTSQILAYQQTDPSSCFYDGFGIIDGAGGGYGTCTGSAIGTTNGFEDLAPATIFQADANAALPEVVPTPAPIALFGLGLMLLGLQKRKLG